MIIGEGNEESPADAVIIRVVERARGDVGLARWGAITVDNLVLIPGRFLQVDVLSRHWSEDQRWSECARKNKRMSFQHRGMHMADEGRSRPESQEDLRFI